MGKRIGDLPWVTDVAASLTGSELLEIEIDGESYKGTPQMIADLLGAVSSTADGVSVADAGGFFDADASVEDALQVLGARPIATDVDLRGDLADAVTDGMGPALVAYAAPVDDALAQSIKSVLDQEISALALIPEDEHAAMRAGTTTYDATAAVQAVLNSGARRIRFPAGHTFRWAGNCPTVPSNKHLIGTGAVIVQSNADAGATISEGDEYCGFRCDEGVADVVIEGFEFRGPYYGGSVTPAYRSIGVHVSGRYDSYFYNNPNYPSQPDVTPSSTSGNVRLLNNIFDGWGQSAVLADNIDGFYALGNVIRNCGRDGIRMYGCQYFNTSDNYITDMAPGFSGEGVSPNNNVYGIAATRVYNSVAGDGSTGVYRPSRYGVMSRNIVRNCYSWKALDTHGGTDISFLDNILINAHIGIGIDKGGFNAADGYAPPRRIKVQGNYIYNDRSHAAGARAGIFAVAHEATDNNFGEDLDILGNTVIGYGTDSADGNIVISNFRRGTLGHNIVKGGVRAGVEFQNTVEDFQIVGGVIADIGLSGGGACRAISCNSTSVRVAIDGVTFRKTDTADTMTAVSLAGAPASGYGVKLGTMCTYQGNVSKVLGPANLDPTSPFVHRVLASGNVSNSGSVTLSGGKGATVSRVGAGQVRITLSEAVSSTSLMFVSAVLKGTGASGAVRVAANVVSTTEVDIYTRDSAGTLTDAGFYFEVRGY